MSRGTRKKKTLRDYTREFPSKGESKRFREAMNAESDLVTALIQAIEVDYLLEQLIISRLARQDEETVTLLCKDNGPLGTFFSKIVLGYALGFFNEREMEYFNTVRRIRNAFAHARKPISFGTDVVRAELAALKLPTDTSSEMHKQISLIKRLCSHEMPDVRDSLTLTGRTAYVILCMSPR